MNLDSDQIVHFRTEKYRIEKRLGFGAVAVVYQATPEAQPDIQVVIKLPKDGTGADPIYHEGIRQEAQTLEILNNAEDPLWPATVTDRFRRVRDDVQRQKRRVIALLDSGDFQGVPFLVQEMAPPEFDRFSILNLADEYRMLRIIVALTETVALAHSNGCAFKDFKPATKADRIRVNWLDDTGSFEFKIIDWNITGTEEDFAADLFMLGGHIYKMLLGRNVLLDSVGHPPIVLGTGIPEWENLTLGTRQIVQRLLHRDEKKRYKTASDVVDDISWWLTVLAIAQEEYPFPGLEKQRLPKGYQREDRNLALVTLALKLNPPPEKQAIYNRWAEQSRAELEKEIWQPIAQGRSDIMMGAYKAAAAEFSRQLLILPKEGEPARVTRLYLLKAQLGQKLGELHKKDIRSTAEWNAVELLINHLVKQDWENADRFFSELISYQTEIEDWESVERLRRLIEAGLLATQAMKQITQIETSSSAYELSDWVVEEETLLVRSTEAIENLRKASRLAPLESNFSQQLQEKGQLFEMRQSRIEQLREVDRLIKEGSRFFDSAIAIRSSRKFSDALHEFQLAKQQYRRAIEIIKPYFQNAELPQIIQWHNMLSARLEQVIESEQSTERISQLMREVQKHLSSGEYDDAQRLLTDRVFTNFDNQQIQLFRNVANAGIELQKEVENKITELERQLSSRYLNDLENTEQATRTLLTQPFTKPNLQPYTLVLQRSTKEKIETVIDRINLLKRIRRNTREALARGDYNLVLSELGKLKDYNIEMSTGEQAWYDQANQAQQDLQEAKNLLDDGDDTEDVFQKIEELIADKPGMEADKLRQQLNEKQRKQKSNRFQTIIWEKIKPNLQILREQIENRKLEDAERLINTLALLPNQTLGFLSQNKNLPPEIRNEFFSPPNEFHETLQYLKQMHGRISDLRQRAQQHYERHEFQELKNLLSSERDFSLTEEEEKWGNDATKHLGKLEEAKRLHLIGLNHKRALDIIKLLNGEKSKDAQNLFQKALDFLIKEIETALDTGDLKGVDSISGDIPALSGDMASQLEALKTRAKLAEVVHPRVKEALKNGDSVTALKNLHTLLEIARKQGGYPTDFTTQEKQWRDAALTYAHEQLTQLELQMRMDGTSSIESISTDVLEQSRNIPEIKPQVQEIYRLYSELWRKQIISKLEEYKRDITLQNLSQTRDGIDGLWRNVPEQVKPNLDDEKANLDAFGEDMDTVIGLQDNQWQQSYDKPTSFAIKTNVDNAKTLDKLDTIPWSIKNKLRDKLRARIAQQVKEFASNISYHVEDLYENNRLIENARELRWMQENLPEIQSERFVRVYTTICEFLKDKLNEIFTRFVNFDPYDNTVFTSVYDDLKHLAEISENLKRDVFKYGEGALNHEALAQWQNVVNTLKNIADTDKYELSEKSKSDQLDEVYKHCDRLKDAKITLEQSFQSFRALELSLKEDAPLNEVFTEAEVYATLLPAIQEYVKNEQTEKALNFFEKLDKTEREQQEKGFSIFSTLFPVPHSDSPVDGQPHRFSSWMLKPHRETLIEIIKNLPNDAEAYFSTVFETEEPAGGITAKFLSKLKGSSSDKSTNGIRTKILPKLEAYSYPFTSVYDVIENAFIQAAIAYDNSDAMEVSTSIVIARYVGILTEECLLNVDVVIKILKHLWNALDKDDEVVLQILQTAITNCNNPDCKAIKPKKILNRIKSKPQKSLY